MEAEGRARAMMSLGRDVSGVSGWGLDFLWGGNGGTEGKGRKGRAKPRDGSGDEERAMDVNVEDASPGLEIVFDREFRPCDTGEADEDIDAVEFPSDVRNGLVDRLFDRDIHLLKTDKQLPSFFSRPAGTIKMLYSLHPHLLINVKNSQYLDAMLKESPSTGEAETLGSTGHWRSN